MLDPKNSRFLKPFSSKDVQDMLLNKAIYKTWIVLSFDEKCACMSLSTCIYRYRHACISTHRHTHIYIKAGKVQVKKQGFYLILSH